MNCLLAIPSWSQKDTHPAALRKKGTGIWQPLGLMYLAAALRRARHQVSILDGVFYDPDDLLRKATAKDPRFIGVYANAILWEKAMGFCRRLKEKMPGAHICVGGPLPSFLKEDCLKQCPEIDSLAFGEGEQTIVELVSRLENGASLKDVRGVIARENRTIIVNEPRPFLQNLDDLPFPARDLIERERYLPPIGLYSKLPIATMFASRGCSNDCLYCYRLSGSVVRWRSAENIVDEMQELVEKYGIREIRFWDDTFTVDRERTLAIAGEIQKRNLKIDWTIATRVDAVDEEMLRNLKKAGCYSILFGVESGVQKNLDVLRKNFTPAQVEKAVRLTRRAGIRTFLTAIFGIPGENYREALATIRFVKKLKPYAASFFTMTPFPGTDLHANVKKYGRMRSNSFSALGLHLLSFVPYTMTKEEIEKLRRIAFLRVCGSPDFIIRKVFQIRSREEIGIYFRGFLTILYALIPSWMKKELT